VFECRASPAAALARPLFCLLGLLACAAPALGQPASQTTPRDLRPEPALPSPAPLPQPPAAPPKAVAPGAGLTVTLARIEVEGGFPEFVAATKALATPYAGRRVSVGELYQLAEDIEGLYRQAGFVLVRVIIPPQQVQDGGTFRILVLDGFIEHVDLAGVDAGVRDQVQAIIAPIVGRPRVTSNDLERLLTLAGRAPGVTLRSTLAPGTRAGGSVLVLEGEHAKFAGSWAADNRLSSRLGPWQSAIQARANQPFGHGEQAYLYVAGHPNPGRMLRSHAVRRVAGGGVIVPVGHDGLSLNGETTWSDTKNPASLFVPATQSLFERAALRASYPLVLTRTREIALTAALEASHQSTSVPAFGLTLNEDRLRVLRFGVDANQALGESGRLRLSSLLSRGLSQLGARTQEDAAASGIALSRPGADPSFTKLEGGLEWDQVLAAGVQLRTVVRAQKAFGQPLPSAELFSIDGEDALSLFETGALSDDGGWTLRQEVGRQVPLQVGSASVPLHPYVFFAGGRPHSKVGTPTGFSVSYGAGLRASWKAVSFSLEYGRAKFRPGGAEDTKLFVKGQVAF
jgi:hemolysin activation/secretion protein